MPLLDKDTVLESHFPDFAKRQSQIALRDIFGLHDCVGKSDCYINLEFAIMYVFDEVGTGNLTDEEINDILSVLQK